MEKYGRAGQATDDNTIRRMRFAFWITKAADTHLEYVILLFHGNSGYANAPHFYITFLHTLPTLFGEYKHFYVRCM
jgi:hypothetical protein